MENFHPNICQKWEIVNDADPDGLYRTATRRCGCGDLDNDSRSVFSRVTIPLLLTIGALALRMTIDGDREDYADVQSANKADGNGVQGRKPRERMWYLDYARILCVACVVSEHSGGELFSDRNVMWVQQWVVPFLYVVSGIAFMLSKTGILKYEFRLFLVLAIGTAANAVAEMVNGKDPVARPGWTMYQMAYVAVIMIVSALVVPIKEVLKWRAENPCAATPWRLRMIAAVYGLLATASLVLFVGGFSFITDGESLRYESKCHFPACSAIWCWWSNSDPRSADVPLSDLWPFLFGIAHCLLGLLQLCRLDLNSAQLRYSCHDSLQQGWASAES